MGALRYRILKSNPVLLPARHSAAGGALVLRALLAPLAAARFFDLDAGGLPVAAGLRGGEGRGGRPFPRPARAPPSRRTRIDQGRCLVKRDGLRRLVVRQVGVDAIVTHVGAVAAILGDDHAALVRM